ncbi:MAG: hypothetical protein RLW61_18310 [Gammaproteobacteria bacterium]
MDWMKIGSAILLGMMIILLFPRARHMIKHSPAAQAGDWRAFLLPILAVGGFVALLMWLV